MENEEDEEEAREPYWPAVKALPRTTLPGAPFSLIVWIL